jgi:predicted Zn-dependent peptidase
MTILDRTVPPAFQTIDTIHFPKLKHIRLDNGLPLYVINVGNQPIVRLEVIFDAGSWYENTPSAASFAVKMLSEGTKHYNSAQISDYFEGIGAFTDLGPGLDRANITVYGLAKHLEAILTMLNELLTEATFPEKELNDLKNISLQSLKINLEKNAFVANTQFRQQLFGPSHPYGKSQTEASIEAIDSAKIRHFYENRISNRPFTVFLSGQVSDNEVVLVNQFLGQHSPTADGNTQPHFEIKSTAGHLHLDKPDAVQTSIRLGRHLFMRQHPDFYKFMVTNEVLGGYFGSRLMKNIREEKGFTYGISSNMALLRNAGYWAVSTDVKKEFAQATLGEIQKEMKLLQTELVSADELQTVQNFMAGEFAGSLNTAFEIADRVRLMVLEGLEPDFYANYISKIRTVTPQQIIETAQQYLNFEDLQQTLVG